MRTKTITQSALLISLAVVFSFIKIFEMPMGGSINLCTLPIIFSSIKFNTKIAVINSVTFAFIKLLIGAFSGNVFVWCKTPIAVIIVVLFDYILAFGLLGFAGIFKKISLKHIKDFGVYIGVTVVFLIRFICHFVTGVVVWSQWSSQNAYIYSLFYNISYLLPEMLLTLLIFFVLLRFKQIRAILKI